MKRFFYFKTCLAIALATVFVPCSLASVTLSSANFPDDTFRAAVATAANATEGSTFDQATLTTLDLPGMNISGVRNLTGLELLTGLTYLDISGNSLLTIGADLTGLTALTTLKTRNCNIRTLAGTSEAYDGTTYAGLTLGSGNSALRYLDLSNNSRFFTSGNLKYLSNLETLLLKDCTHYDFWGYQPGLGMTSLKWVDVSGCTAMDRIYLRGATQLKHLNADGTAVKGFTTSPSNSATTQYYIVLSANSPVEYINIGHCAITNEGLNGITTYGVASLDTLILKGNGSFGYSTAFAHMPALSYLDISDCDIYFREGSNPYYLLHYLTPTNNPNLETLLVSNSNLGVNTTGISGFSKLKTVDVSGNPGAAHFWVNGSPLLESLNISGNTGITYLQLNNDNLPRSDFNLIGAGSCSSLTSLYLNGNNYSSIADAKNNFSSIGTLTFLYLQNNSGFTGGPLTLNADDCGTLTGIDLGNNGFTSFNAPSLPPTLTALMLGDNPGLTRLEMHNNPGITSMTASPTMTNGSGLYLLGNAALTYMDISGTAEQPNHFQRIGNNSSLNGVPIDTLKASYNKFYTFRNLTTVPGGRYEVCRRSNYAYSMSDTLPSARYYYSAFWPTMAACPDSASVEQLTGLKYLDLSHCQLKDSVYLHKNTELRYLDVSHNRTIKRYTTSQDKGAGYRASIPAYSSFNRDYPDYKKYLWLVDTQLRYPGRQEAYDQEYYTLDYNDTIGLYILDLMDNDKLEYLDVSYTGIEQTALTHCHVSNARFMWIQDLHNLKYLYADYNGMRSMGIGTLNGKYHKEALKSLERLSVIGMRGADITTMQGSMNFLNNGRCPKLHYVNVSYSDFDSIGFHAPQIDTIIAKGNPIHHLNVQDVDSITYIDVTECAFKQRGYDPETHKTVAIPETLTMRFLWTNYNTGQTYDSIQTITMNGARSNGLYSGAVTTPWSGLRTIQAHHRPKLTTLLVNKSNALQDVYCYFDPLLTGITGFDDLPYPKDSVDAALGYGADVDSLNLVWVNDDSSLVDLNLTKNINLRYLHAYNDKALGDALDDMGMQLNENVILNTAWVSNSRLKKFTNNAGDSLEILWIWDNPELKELDVANNRHLRSFDLRNCMVRNLNVQPCDSLIYFDCSNDSIKGNYQDLWYGYSLPRAVPMSVNEPGKNSIADLHFGSKRLEVVKADKNDLFSLKGLNDNPNLTTLHYSYNHINAIDLRGSNNITSYECTHNGRGAFEAEYSKWYKRNGENADTCHLYYLQLDPNAGDELDPLHHDSYLGFKWGHDSLEAEGDDAYFRIFDADGFDPAKVKEFNVNSSGPFQGTRGQTTTRGQVVYNTDSILDPSTFYGLIAILDTTNNQFKPGYNYIEYQYYDGRQTANREAATSTYYMVWYAPPGTTEVEETVQDDLGTPYVISESYFDISGAEHSEPFNGVNIIVRKMSDGTTQTVKVIRR